LWVGSNGHAEVDFGTGVFSLSGGTQLRIGDLRDTKIDVVIKEGDLGLTLLRKSDSELLEVTLPGSSRSVTFDEPGTYRLHVHTQDSGIFLDVEKGTAEVLLADGGPTPVTTGQRVGLRENSTSLEIARLPPPEAVPNRPPAVEPSPKLYQ
jgi:hypothetical protein